MHRRDQQSRSADLDTRDAEQRQYRRHRRTGGYGASGRTACNEDSGRNRQHCLELAKQTDQEAQTRQDVSWQANICIRQGDCPP